jgi:hypothetical protein
MSDNEPIIQVFDGGQVGPSLASLNIGGNTA